MISYSVTHLRSYTNTTFARNSMPGHNGKLESGTAREKLPFPWNIYKRSGQQSIESGQKHYLGQKACKKICTQTLKLSNSVLVRVPNNNYNYEQPIALLIILLAKHLCHGVIQCNRCFAKCFYSTHINANANQCQCCIAECRYHRNERQCSCIKCRVFEYFMMLHSVLRVFHDVNCVFHDNSHCFTSVS